MSNRKIFGIGFHKTGTTSLARALRILGYRVTGPNRTGDPKIGLRAHAIADNLVKRYDAFQDNPWPIIYRYIDEKYPGSRFILTVRPTDDWIDSVVRHFGSESTPMRKWIYGVGYPLGNEKIYIDRYERHNQDVKDHLKDRPDDLLVMDITKGDGWEKLCPFLGMEIPAEAFPRLNTAGQRETLMHRLKLLIGRLGFRFR